MRPTILCFVLFCGFFHLSDLRAEDENPITDPALLEILENYVESRGGQARIAQLTSLTFTGKIYENEKVIFDVVNVQKQPNKSRLVLEQGLQRMTIGYDGIRAWMRREVDGQRLPRMELPLEQRDVAIREADFIDPLINYKQSGYEYTLLPDSAVNGFSCYVVEVKRVNMPGSERFYLDKDNYTLLKRIVSFPSDKGEMKITSLYGDYRQVAGIPIAYEIRTQAEGQREQVIIWDSVIPNKGVFDSYFSDR